ncbi:uracil-DNA glycosylase [Winogradskyella sp.]|nr:uracil-DNA glycosylase [Winogradskyella sp.]MDB9755646.1 uracil-DNA glycosylase [Winogradskyella sp.]MDC0006693.1 uracil-DNA glycosylase [Winogradskyella sp.]
MITNIHESWKPYLQPEFDKTYFKDLLGFVENEYNNQVCYPKLTKIFNAFNQCHFNDIKVVIIGQDPYHGVGQANGLCFSVNEGVKNPPSLTNIFKELVDDVGVSYPKTGNLISWAKQGVLLINATLTVRAHEAGSHQKQGWEQFTDAIISTINKEKEHVVFLLWGGFAKKKKKLITKHKHFVLETGHPSPLSANRGYWFGNKHFSKTNSLLQQVGLSAVVW